LGRVQIKDGGLWGVVWLAFYASSCLHLFISNGARVNRIVVDGAVFSTACCLALARHAARASYASPAQEHHPRPSDLEMDGLDQLLGGLSEHGPICSGSMPWDFGMVGATGLQIARIGSCGGFWSWFTCADGRI
jgi:hypothetical protein